jgi:hypothetical protein
MCSASVTDRIWCAASSPIISGALVGLSLATVALVTFPTDWLVRRPESGAQSDFSASTSRIRYAKVLRWLLVPGASITLGGYVALYVAAEGKGCDARFTALERKWILAWSLAATLTFVLLIVLAQLRRLVTRGARS